MGRRFTLGCVRDRGRLALALLLALSAQRASAQDDPAVVLEGAGCVACHTLDGRDGVGPSFARAPQDEEALTASILEPDAIVTPGFPAGVMPRAVTTRDEARRLARAVLAIARAPRTPEGERARHWMVLAALAFAGLHFTLSSRAVRGRGVAALGENRYLGLYSLAILASFAWLVLEWRSAPFVALYTPPAWTRWVPNVVMPLAYTLLVMGYTIASPAVAGMASRELPVTGILRITRHPALWGFGLWGLSHLAANGDLRSVALFGSVAVLALGGMLHIDARRRASGGETWARFAARTSLLPFAAIASGRQSWPTLGELGWWRVALGIAGWALMLAIHTWLIGAAPWP